jgi:hypothetical protein
MATAEFPVERNAMNCSRVRTALAVSILAALPGAALAQFQPPPGTAPVQDRWPDAPKSQAPQAQAPAAQPAPKRAAPPPSIITEEPLQTPEAAPAAPAKKPPPAPAYAVTCSGVFAQDSTHLKLAVKYDSRNITYGEVEGPEGSKIPGSILFPNDPKHRLEVLWTNEAGRSGTSVIAINGKSQWSAPKGMKLGLPLAALEKANGKPFKLSGFAADGTAGVAGWEGGALGSLPGGCKVGMKLAADAKAPAAARSAMPADKDFLSNDPAVRALKPTVVEILIGY